MNSRLLALIALAAALAPGCGSPTGSTDAAARPARQAPSFELGAAPEAEPSPPPRGPVDRADGAEPVRLDLELPDLQWSDGPPVAGHRRVAVLVAADQYAEHAWNLAFARASAEELRDVLVQRLGFAPDDVTLLTGDRVYERNIEGAIDAATRDMGGPGNVLLVHWVGHGFSVNGSQQLLTYHSGQSSGAQAERDGGYSDTLPYERLTGWLADASRRVATGGGELRTGMVLDACRVATRAAPRRIVDHVPAVDVEAFSAPLGQPAADSEADFTALLCRALATARGQRVGLLDALLAAGREITARSPDVKPEIASGDRDLVLLDRADLAVVIEAVDASTDPPRPLRGARIQLNGVERPAPDGRAVFGALAASSEGYDLRVQADGYFWRTAELVLTPETSGSLVRVPMAPEYVVLTGTLAMPRTSRAEVKVSGGFVDPIPDYHVTRAVVPAGRFVLKVPRESGPRRLVIVPNGDSAAARERPFDLDDMLSTTRTENGVRVSLYDFGPITFEAGGREAMLGGTEAVVGSVAVEFDLGAVSAADFTGRNAFSFFGEVSPSVERREYGRALRDVEALIAQGRVSESGRERLAHLRAELELADVISRAEARRQGGDLSGATDLLLDSPVREDPRVTPVLRSWLLADAGERHARGAFDDAAARLAQAIAITPASTGLLDDVQAQLRQVRRDGFEQAFGAGLASGDWQSVHRALDAARPVLSPADGESMAQRLERESISPACRAAYRAGESAYARGDLEAAWEAYQHALDAGANDWYAAAIAQAVTMIREDLFAKFNAIGAERLGASDTLGSYRAYLRAWDYDPLVQSRIESLLDDPAVLAAEPRAPEDFGRAVAERRWRQVSQQIGGAIESERLDDAAALLVEARALPGGDPDRIAELQQRLDSKREAVEQRDQLAARQALANLGDRATYAELDEDQVLQLVHTLEATWPELLRETFRFHAVERYEAGGRAHVIALFMHPASGLDFALVPGGAFRMGSPDDERGRELDEPVHDERVVPFLVATTECTGAAWRASGDGGEVDGVPDVADDEPMRGVDWGGAFEWCRQAGLQLPNEAQWEWAARAGTDTPYSTGPELTGATTGRPFEERPAPVARGTANAFGLYDVHGNVAEWCSNPYGDPRDLDWSRLGRVRDDRVARGGGYSSTPEDARSAARVRLGHDFALKTIGFRPTHALPTLPELP